MQSIAQTRLYVVLVPGLLFGFFWDRMGSWLSAARGIYAHSLSDLGPAVPLKNLTLGTLLGNLLFLQTILCETFGSNGPLWSLANEFWYYALFPVSLGAGLAWAVRRFRKPNQEPDHYSPAHKNANQDGEAGQRDCYAKPAHGPGQASAKRDRKQCVIPEFICQAP